MEQDLPRKIEIYSDGEQSACFHAKVER